MANDGSIASQVEEWAVTTLTIADSGSAFKRIAQYDGTVEETGQRIAKEMVSASRNPIALVFVRDSFTREEGDRTDDRIFDLLVLVGVRNERGGVAARCGDDTRVGIHRAMELVADALGGGNPGSADPANKRQAVRVEHPVGAIVHEEKGLYVATVQFAVRAVPPAP